MKNFGNNKLITIIKNNFKFIILFTLLSFLNIFFLCQNFKLNSLSFGKTFFFILISSILLEIILCIIILIARQKQWRIEKLFLIVGLMIGTLYVLTLPMGRAPDEASHFFRAYELSTGHLISDVSENNLIGSTEPSDLKIVLDFKENNVTYSSILDNLTIHENTEDQTFIQTSAYSYNIFSYLPQVLGILTGKILHLPLLITIYISKFFNLIACISILYLCMKHIPFLKNFIFLLAFLPITMQAMSSVSPDGLSISTSIALISFILYSIYILKDKFSKKHLCILFTICLFLSMGKIAYSPLCLMIFAIPKERFNNNKKKILTIFAFGFSIAIILFTWLILAPSIQSAYDSATQTSLILSNPLKYLAIVINSISTNAHLYISGFLGGYLEWFNIVLSPIYLIPSSIIFVLLIVKECSIGLATKSLKTLSALAFTAVIMITFTTMFIQWTKVGEVVIDGVQGRYFLPLALIIPIWFLPNKNPSSSKKNVFKTHQNYYLYTFFIFESIYAITTIICSHI